MSVLDRGEQFVRTTEALGDLIRVLDRVANRLELLERHNSDLQATLRGMWVNDTLWAGAISFSGYGEAIQKGFSVPYASILVHDPYGVGPFFIRNDGSLSDTDEYSGPGNWQTAAGFSGTVPLTGSEVSIVPSSSGIAFFAFFTRPVQPTTPATLAAST